MRIPRLMLLAISLFLIASFISISQPRENCYDCHTMCGRFANTTMVTPMLAKNETEKGETPALAERGDLVVRIISATKRGDRVRIQLEALGPSNRTVRASVVPRENEFAKPVEWPREIEVPAGGSAIFEMEYELKKEAGRIRMPEVVFRTEEGELVVRLPELIVKRELIRPELVVLGLGLLSFIAGIIMVIRSKPRKRPLYEPVGVELTEREKMLMEIASMIERGELKRAIELMGSELFEYAKRVYGIGKKATLIQAIEETAIHDPELSKHLSVYERVLYDPDYSPKELEAREMFDYFSGVVREAEFVPLRVERGVGR